MMLVLIGCGLERPAKTPPFDCALVDRAEERFPDRCGPDSGMSDGGEDTDDASVAQDAFDGEDV